MPESSSSPKGPLPRPRGPGAGQQLFEDKEPKGKRDRKNKPRATPLEVKEFHEASDKDASVQSHHHTLGPNPTQAAPGNHSHRLIGLWLYKGTDGTHNSTGNYIDTAWTDYKFWDKEYFAKVDSSTFTPLKRAVYDVTYRVSFATNSTAKRGVRFLEDGTPTQTFEMTAVSNDATRVWDYIMAIELVPGSNYKVQSFQSSGGNLTINNGRHITHLKVVRRFPQKIDSQGLTAGGIVPQTPGPEIASRQFYLNGSW